MPEHTRRDAAESIATGTHPLREIVFDFVRRRGDRGATDHEIAGELLMLTDTARARRCELRDAGRIVDSGESRATPSGRRAIVWVVPEEGRGGEKAESGERKAGSPELSTSETARAAGIAGNGVPAWPPAAGCQPPAASSSLSTTHYPLPTTPGPAAVQQRLFPF